MATPEKLTARDRLLQAAASLFYRDGVSATGIDAITDRAGVAKQSLYNNFKSKADLIAAYLADRHDEWLGLYALRLAAAITPAEKILAVFEAYEDHAEFAYENGFRGCGLLNAASELPAGHAGRAAVRSHKEEVEAILAGHLAEIVPDDALKVERTAAQLSYLLEGAMARAGLEGNSRCLKDAKMMADSLVRSL